MQAELRIIRGIRQGDRVPVPPDGVLLVGRGPEAAIQIRDAGISRRHCEIGWSDRRLFVRDLESANGTFVNGRRVGEAVLSPHDEVRVGSTVLLLDLVAGREGETVKGRICTRCGRNVERPADPPPPGEDFLCASCREEEGPDFRLPGFRTIRKLGEGGMGTVYLAQHELMQRRVAIKVMKEGMAAELDSVARFEREASSLAKLSHPHVVRFFPVVRQGDTFFIVMEYVPGGTLMDRIQEHGWIGIDEALAIGLEICDALSYVHGHDLVHRDVKPPNIFWAGGATPAKLGDFGLAKTMSRAGRSAITAPGTPLGTLGYIAPEQLRNALEADHRADVYGLGAALYHAIAGRRPFEGKALQKVMMDILRTAPPPVTDFRPGCPEELARVLDRCLRKDPEERIQTADELAEGLEEVDPPDREGVDPGA